MSTGEKIYNRLKAASESNLQASAAQLCSKRELRALMSYCESLPASEATTDILAVAMVEIVRRFMAKNAKKS